MGPPPKIAAVVLDVGVALAVAATLNASVAALTAAALASATFVAACMRSLPR